MGNFLRRLALPATPEDWWLRSIQTKLINIGAKIVYDARRRILQMAEVAVPNQPSTQTLRRVRAFAPG